MERGSMIFYTGFDVLGTLNVIFAGGGNDVDRLYGHDGDDLLFGGDGNDLLYGMGDNDILNGGNGNDGLRGGAGDGLDYLYGESGADTFMFYLNSIDRVRDFNLAEGGMLDLSNLLTGFDVVTDDINDFVDIIVRDATRTNVRVNAEGQGNDGQYVGIVSGDLTGETLDTLLDSGTIIV